VLSETMNLTQPVWQLN